MEEAGNGGTVSSLEPRFADVRAEWHWVGPIINELLEDNPDVQAIPEDIYADCKSGKAHLWVSDHYVLITEFEVTEYSGEINLCISYAHAINRGQKLGIEVMDYLEEFARKNKCAGITFGTRHQPLINYLCNELGFRVSTQILKREIGYNHGTS
jgi:GNAT superfamily N-acetyltransferase